MTTVANLHGIETRSMSSRQSAFVALVDLTIPLPERNVFIWEVGTPPRQNKENSNSQCPFKYAEQPATTRTIVSVHARTGHIRKMVSARKRFKKSRIEATPGFRRGRISSS